MSMLIMKLRLVFAVIIAILWMKRPLFWAISGSLAVILILYGVHVSDTLSIMGRALVSRDIVTVVLGFYFITSLQCMLERGNRLEQAEQSLNWLSDNRRVNASAALAVIGLLLPAGTMTICAGIVRPPCQNYLSNEDMTCVISSYRHISESFLSTYFSILITLAVSGMGAGESVLTILSLVAALFTIGHIFYLRRMSRPAGQKPEGGRKKVTIILFKGLWSILLTVMLLITFDIPVYVTTSTAAILSILMDHLKPWEIMSMFRTTFEPVVIFNTILIMIFKDIIAYTGVIHELSVFFGDLSIPLPMVLILIFFFSTIISGPNAIISLCMPMVIVAISEAGAPLPVPLMGSTYAATQVSPTHVCLFITAEYFKVDIGTLVRRSIPMILMSFVATLACIAFLDVL